MLEAPERSNARLARSALLTIDLTQAVADATDVFEYNTKSSVILLEHQPTSNTVTL